MRKVSLFFPLAIILILSFFSWKVLLSPGFFTMHDDQQVARLYQLDKSLSFGQFPVRWVKDLGFGYGYPLFNFYPPVVYYVGEMSHLLLGASFISSTKIVWFLALAGSALTMYFLAKEFFGKVGGVISALFYLYAPYHAVDAYVRGALAELFSFVLLPLILLTSYKTYKTNKAYFAILTGFFLALLMLTHNLVFLPFFGLYSLWSLAVFLIYGDKRKILLAASYYLLASLVAFGLTAFFWAPALFEKQYTLVDQLLIKSLASYKIHFVCLNQLWDSPWGYGGSGPNCISGLSFKIGKLHVLMSLLSLVIVTNLWIKRNRKLSLLILISTFLALLSAFMTIEYSGFIWDHLPPLWYLQFPWRFLEFVALFASFLAGSIFLVIKNQLVRAAIASAILIALILPNAKYFTPQTFLTRVNDSQLTSDEEIKWHVSSTSFEYMPKDIATKLTPEGALWVDIDQGKIARRDYRVISGNINIDRAQIAPDKFLISAHAVSSGLLQMQISNFPGWRVWLDKNSVPIDDNNPYKLITIQVPPGIHTIFGQFTDTPVRFWGNTISLIFLTALLLYGGRTGIRRSS